MDESDGEEFPGGTMAGGAMAGGETAAAELARLYLDCRRRDAKEVKTWLESAGLFYRGEKIAGAPSSSLPSSLSDGRVSPGGGGDEQCMNPLPLLPLNPGYRRVRAAATMRREQD